MKFKEADWNLKKFNETFLNLNPQYLMIHSTIEMSTVGHSRWIFLARSFAIYALLASLTDSTALTHCFPLLGKSKTR